MPSSSMPSERDRIRLQHMLDAARIAVRSAAVRRREDLDDEEDLLVHGLVRLVTVVGEAASGISQAAHEQMQEIPWPDVVNMRHRLVHGYYDIDLDILWSTVRTSLPELIRQLERVLTSDQST